MAEDRSSPEDMSRIFAELLEAQTETAQHIFGQFLPGSPLPVPGQDEVRQWTEAAAELQQMWLRFQEQQALPDRLPPFLSDPAQWMEYADAAYRQMPLAHPDRQKDIWRQSLELWEEVLGQYGIGPKAASRKEGGPELPLKDRRFSDPRWREQPVFALIHQTYLMMAGQMLSALDGDEGL